MTGGTRNEKGRKRGKRTNRTYGELSDGIINNVEPVGSGKVEGDLDDQRSRVNHTGLDNQDEDLRSAKVAGYTRDHAEHVPNNRMGDLR